MALLSMQAEVKNSEMSDAAGSGRCWSCGAAVDTAAHFCPECDKVQPPAATDYFSIFNLPRRLNLDTARLEKEFYRLSRMLHPDLFGRASSQEQEWSTERSSQLNDAYRALRDPISRTQHLLSLEGFKLEEQSRAATDAARASGGEKKQVVPPELLEEVFELNIQLQELKMGERDPEVMAQLETAKGNFEQRLEALATELRTLWSRWDNAQERHDSTAGRDSLQKMIDLLNRRSYIRNLVRDVKEALAD